MHDLCADCWIIVKSTEYLLLKLPENRVGWEYTLLCENYEEINV